MVTKGLILFFTLALFTEVMSFSMPQIGMKRGDTDFAPGMEDLVAYQRTPVDDQTYVIMVEDPFIVLSDCDPPNSCAPLDTSDYEAEDNPRESPVILSGKTQSHFNVKPVYISPDLDDALDKGQDVHHEEVHGIILMPRVRFVINDACEDDDYFDYAGHRKMKHRGITGETRPRTLRRPLSRRSKYDPLSRVPVLNPRDPTLEEMVPWSKVPKSQDTYILLTDDPVLVVDSKINCHKT